MFHFQKRLLSFVPIISVSFWPTVQKHEAPDNERVLLNMSALMKAAVKKGLVEFAGNRANYLLNNIMSPPF